MERRLYTVGEVAEILGVTKPTVRRIAYDGHMSYVDIGTAKQINFRFLPEHVEEYIQRRERKAN